jgi:hypothetical protein
MLKTDVLMGDYILQQNRLCKVIEKIVWEFIESKPDYE